MCDQKSTEKLEAEICWAFFPHVSAVTEKPSHIMRGKGPDPRNTWLDSAPSLTEELVRCFLALSLVAVASFTSFLKHPVPSSLSLLVSVQRRSPTPGHKDLCSSLCSVGIQHSQAAKTTN